jgi:hypothetical protein
MNCKGLCHNPLSCMFSDHCTVLIWSWEIEGTLCMVFLIYLARNRLLYLIRVYIFVFKCLHFCRGNTFLNKMKWHSESSSLFWLGMLNVNFLSAKIASLSLKMAKIFLGGFAPPPAHIRALPLGPTGDRAPRPSPLWHSLNSLAGMKWPEGMISNKALHERCDVEMLS